MSFSKLVFACSLFSLLIITNVFAAQINENPKTSPVTSYKEKTDYFGKYRTTYADLLNQGESQLSGSAAYASIHGKATSIAGTNPTFTIDSKVTKTGAEFGYQYGVTNQVNLESDLIYITGSRDQNNVINGVPSDSNETTKGISELRLKAQFGLANYNWGYLGELSFSPNIGRASSDNRNKESNAYLEQSKVTLKNYLIFNTSNVKWGGILGYNYAIDGEYETISNSGTSTITTVTGGSSFIVDGFVEFERLYNLNFTVEYVKFSSGTLTDTSGTIDRPEYATLELISSLNFKVTPELSLVPELSYMTLPYKDVGPNYNFDQYDGYAAKLTARYLF